MLVTAVFGVADDGGHEVTSRHDAADQRTRLEQYFDAP